MYIDKNNGRTLQLLKGVAIGRRVVCNATLRLKFRYHNTYFPLPWRPNYALAPNTLILFLKKKKKNNQPALYE
jgi:hypothetical protein